MSLKKGEEESQKGSSDRNGAEGYGSMQGPLRLCLATFFKPKSVYVCFERIRQWYIIQIIQQRKEYDYI